MLFTGSHFRNYTGCKRVSISIGNPENRKYDGLLSDLAPRWDMLKMGKSDYIKNYDIILEEAESKGIIKNLLQESSKCDIVLLCWEHDSFNCHRKLLADYIREKHGVAVREKTPD